MKRSGMPQRRTPLRRSTKPIARRKAIDRARRRKTRPQPPWASWRAQERAAVHERRYCEVDVAHGAQWVLGTDAHHPFGRLEEPWASSQIVGLLLCHEHHELAHRTASFRDWLRWKALERFARHVGVNVDTIDGDPRRAFRTLRLLAGDPPGFDAARHRRHKATGG